MSMRNSKRGFTLISVMIVVAIVGILAAIAYPSYIDQVRQSRRTEAISLLMRAANEQEQYYAIEQTYANTMDKLDMESTTESGWYQVTKMTGDTDGFRITVTPQNDQANDDCGTFSIDETGARWANSATRSPTSDISKECW